MALRDLFWFVGLHPSGFSLSSGSSERTGVSSLLPESGAGGGGSSVNCGTGQSISGCSGRFCRTTTLENPTLLDES